MFSRVILNARLALEMPCGSPITCGFVVGDDLDAVEEELKKWPKLDLPNNAIQTAGELQRDRMGVHVSYGVVTEQVEAQPDDSGR